MLRVVVAVEVVEAGESREPHTRVKVAKTLDRLAPLHGRQGYHYTGNSLEAAAIDLYGLYNLA
jgi:hypothetical protein